MAFRELLYLVRGLTKSGIRATKSKDVIRDLEPTPLDDFHRQFVSSIWLVPPSRRDVLQGDPHSARGREGVGASDCIRFALSGFIWVDKQEVAVAVR